MAFNMYLCALTHLLVVLVTSHVSSNCTTNYTATIGTATLPNKDKKIAVGYNAESRTVAAIGGELHPSQFFKFMVDTETFEYNATQMANYSLIEIEGSASYYTQVDHTLWIVSKYGTAFITLNLETYAVQQTDIAFPSRVKYGAACLTSYDEYLFVVGGDQYLHSIQIYNISGGEWLDNVPLLSEGRKSPACVVVNRVLYTIGGTGFRDSAWEALDTIETATFNADGSVTAGGLLNQRLKTPLLGANAVKYGSDILVIGGSNDVESISDVTVINTETQSVAICGSLAIAAAYVAPVIAEHTLYLFGGYNDHRAFGEWELDSFQKIALPQLETTAAPDTTATAPATTVTSTDALTTAEPDTTTTAPATTVASTDALTTARKTTGAVVPSSQTTKMRTTVSKETTTAEIRSSTSQAASSFGTSLPGVTVTDEGRASDSSDSFNHSEALLVIIVSASVVVIGIIACYVCQNKRRIGQSGDGNEMEAALVSDIPQVDNDTYHLL